MWQQLLINEKLVTVVSSWGKAVWTRLRSLSLLVPRTVQDEPWRKGRSQNACRKAARAKLVESGKVDVETHSNKILPCQ